MFALALRPLYAEKKRVDRANALWVAIAKVLDNAQRENVESFLRRRDVLCRCLMSQLNGLGYRL